MWYLRWSGVTSTKFTCRTAGEGRATGGAGRPDTTSTCRRTNTRTTGTAIGKLARKADHRPRPMTKWG